MSYAQNGEDVVLWRALRQVESGRFVDVGGWDPDEDSVTRLFYEQGWRGIDIEPVPELAERFRARRPLDEVVQAVITDEPTGTSTLHTFGQTGLATIVEEIAERHRGAGLPHEVVEVPARRLDDVLTASSVVTSELHLLNVDVEGAERQVLASLDLTRWRPWVLVVESKQPNSERSTHQEWEPAVLAAGYTFALFDGLSRFYVSPEHLDLLPELSYPACVLDGFEPAVQVRLSEQLAARDEELGLAQDETLQWRNRAVSYWAESMAAAQRSADAAIESDHEAESLRVQVTRLRATVRELRAERDRLRGRVKRLNARVAEVDETRPDESGRTGTGLRALGSRIRRGSDS